MSTDRTDHVQTLKERIRRCEYRVDASAVARAMLERLALVDLTAADDLVPRGVSGGSARVSGDVLEAG